MTPKDRREKLFKDRKPLIRPLETEDLRWLYASYKYPDPPEDDFEDFVDEIKTQLMGYDEAFIIEDRNKMYKEGFGAVAIVPCHYDGWKLEPHVTWFSWATKLNVIRCHVAFFIYARYNSDIGVTVIHSIDEKQKTLYKGLKKYAPIYPVGKIPAGHATGDDFLFYIRGKKKTTTNMRV